MPNNLGYRWIHTDQSNSSDQIIYLDHKFFIFLDQNPSHLLIYSMSSYQLTYLNSSDQLTFSDQENFNQLFFKSSSSDISSRCQIKDRHQ